MNRMRVTKGKVIGTVVVPLPEGAVVEEFWATLPPPWSSASLRLPFLMPGRPFPSGAPRGTRRPLSSRANSAMPSVDCASALVSASPSMTTTGSC